MSVHTCSTLAAALYMDRVVSHTTGSAQALQIYPLHQNIHHTLSVDVLCSVVCCWRSQVYHLPGSAHYSSTQISESSGERWFCNAYDAEVAGWRPAGCTIKGDIDAASGNKLFYTSQHSQYKSVKVDVAAGERWFCSSSEANAAGWAAAPTSNNNASPGGRNSMIGL
jgi:hypothetical protein